MIPKLQILLSCSWGDVVLETPFVIIIAWIATEIMIIEHKDIKKASKKVILFNIIKNTWIWVMFIWKNEKTKLIGLKNCK